ncbi:MAG: 50S ribosomal protein L31 [Candidatus Harrisonbacteria bacterium RIFCSPHIGHO2_01_FULL_44_13]|uniref:Large ribosomal subunit protein bL31 n=1 Tax=Candidatus Harrisonbacteria bacterium RIFCSPLOWO2_01_FULL_44_18 TaxID=1798407 RepID=A0A1G1ZR60_9BACT|nr:MAG: 50S ribosomal protein L31 [Candidatus Harrisonbacteria bacterium RIFCSPHIGHO2_01_FULL_44_13]OGY66307.1 MAG: 50S ribosomal protein L31 [Candidatus Harrisonbacteria bacterium RIFCSPLOWO2_01_FULL_44_18]
MKKDIHPQYYNDTEVRCACGNKFKVGSTKPDLDVEICYKCHPFYTGKEKFIGIAGKVEKFKARRAKAAAKPKTAKKPRVKKQKK